MSQDNYIQIGKSISLGYQQQRVGIFNLLTSLFPNHQVTVREEIARKQFEGCRVKFYVEKCFDDRSERILKVEQKGSGLQFCRLRGYNYHFLDLARISNEDMKKLMNFLNN